MSTGFGLANTQWESKCHDGIGPATNNFLMYYFILTGLHPFCYAVLLGPFLIH